MAAIGNSPTQQAFTPAIDYFSGNGSTTAFTLSRPVASVAQVQVTIDNVAQNPSSAYTVSSNTITFTSAPLSGTNNIYVYYTSPITQVIAPGQGTVTSDSFGTITNFTTTGNTVLGDATTDTLTVGVTGIVKDASGNVGIGTTSPSYKLDVQVAGDVVSRIYNTANSNNTYFRAQNSTATGWFGVGGTGPFMYTADSVPLLYYTAGSERMRILSTGEVGVKTSTPQTNLDIGGSISQKGLEIRCGDQNSGANGGIQIVLAYDGNAWNSSGYSHTIKTRHDSANNGNNAIEFFVWTTSVSASSLPTYKSMSVTGTGVAVTGSLSKGSGSFKIDHPLTAKKDTHHLVHSFIEGPQADLIYRGKVSLVDGAAIINIDTANDMTEGTFVALCRNVQCFTTNESDWTPVRGSVTGNILTIEAQDNASTASISWMVIGERQDKHMYDTDWTDENGKVIVEPLKEALENR